MDLKTFLESFESDKQAGLVLGVKERTVASWRRGERIPRPKQADRLVESGLISYEEIYRPSDAHQRGRGRSHDHNHGPDTRHSA